MCAYLIENTDKEIHEPIARIAIKRFEGENNTFIFLPEKRIYGDEEFAMELNFLQEVKTILAKSNKETQASETFFKRNDEESYSDSLDSSVQYYNIDKFDKFTEEQLSKVNWNTVSEQANLPKEFIEKYQDYLNWTLICRYQKLTDDEIIKYKKHFTLNAWNNLSRYQELSDKIIDSNINLINWNVLSKNYKHITPQFLEKYKEHINWTGLCKFQTLTEEEIRKFKDFIPFEDLSINKNLSDEFIITLLKTKRITVQQFLFNNFSSYFPMRNNRIYY